MKKIMFCILFLGCVLTSYADNYSFLDLNGREVSYEKLVEGPNTVFLMWTTWCPYCRKELARLDKVYEKYSNISFVIVNLGEQRSKIDRFLKSSKLSNKLKQKIIIDPQSNLAQEFDIIGIPAYVMVKDGKFVNKYSFLNDSIINEVFCK